MYVRFALFSHDSVNENVEDRMCVTHRPLFHNCAYHMTHYMCMCIVACRVCVCACMRVHSANGAVASKM